MIAYEPYFLRMETKNLDLVKANEQDLSDAENDCLMCIGHYPEDPQEIRLAIRIRDQIRMELLKRKSFFGDN